MLCYSLVLVKVYRTESSRLLDSCFAHKYCFNKRSNSAGSTDNFFKKWTCIEKFCVQVYAPMYLHPALAKYPK